MQIDNKICSFFGHRSINVTNELYTILKKEILSSIEKGCNVFYFGGFGDFDELCRRTVANIKNSLHKNNIKLVYCVPQERYLRRKSNLFNSDDYDQIIYLEPSFTGWYKSIYFRNCAMIDQSDTIIFYVQKRENSGAYKAYEYAKKQKNKLVINLYKD